MSINVMDVSDNDRIILSFCIALGLHIAILLLLPLLNHAPVKPPERFDIDLTQTEMQLKANLPKPAAPQPEQPQTKPAMSKVETKPQQKALPVLATHTDTPPTPMDTQVPDTPTVATTESATPSAPVSSKAESSKAESSPNETSLAPSSNQSQTVKSEEAEPSEAWQGYGQQLYDTMAKNKSYPATAIRRHLEGQVNLIAKFNMGKLVEVTVQDAGSGHQVLDSAAIEMLKKAINAMPVKGALLKKSFTVIVPVNFKLEG